MTYTVGSGLFQKKCTINCCFHSFTFLAMRAKSFRLSIPSPDRSTNSIISTSSSSVKSSSSSLATRAKSSTTTTPLPPVSIKSKALLDFSNWISLRAAKCKKADSSNRKFSSFASDRISSDLMSTPSSFRALLDSFMDKVSFSSSKDLWNALRISLRCTGSIKSSGGMVSGRLRFLGFFRFGGIGSLPSFVLLLASNTSRTQCNRSKESNRQTGHRLSCPSLYKCALSTHFMRWHGTRKKRILGAASCAG
mmetsp:Transcript_42057/g.101383  ORF Transcript_42057/g.101383 Transcript_42057/m.101383 type:complete len:250 (+) Transcript_42057:649-1398(+)